MNSKTLVLCLLSCLHTFAFAQIFGVVTDDDGQPLAYATVFVANTTYGTTTNSDGYYELKVKPDQHSIVFQHLGYEQKTKTIEYKGEPIEINCSLIPHSYSLETLDIFASAEDPAYPIMRNVIERRSFYRDYLDSYKCDVYVKGLFELDKVPNMFLEAIREGMAEGTLDSTGRGIIYLSESESEYFFQKPNKVKEVLVSSKVSGDPQGFSFNRFGVLNFYGNQLNIGRPLVNPIGDNAFTHYTYSLEKTFYDENKRMVHHIIVTPKNEKGPVFSGELYILDGQWLLHSLDLTLTGESAKVDPLESVRFRQQFIPADDKYWSLFSQIIDFRAGLLGFEFSGNFTAVTNNFVVNPSFEKGFFSREVVQILEGSNKKDEDYWLKARPVPLASREEEDYTVKDSIAEVVNSKPYMDSVDRSMNRFKLTSLLGYTYRKSYEGHRITYRPNTELYDPIRGWTLGPNLEYTKDWKEITGKQFRVNGSYLYGFSDSEHRGSVSVYKRFNARSQFFVNAYAGYELLDINPVNTVSTLYNSSIALFGGETPNRYYNARRLQLETGREVGFGHFIRGQVELADRREAFNTAMWSFRGRETEFPPNNDFGTEDRDFNVADHVMLSTQVSFTWRPGMRFTSYPDRRVYRGSRWPVFRFLARAGWEDMSNLDYSFASLSIQKNNIVNSIFGSLSFNVEGGSFFDQPTYLHDYKHFIGSPLLLMDADNYLKGFKMLPLYAFSSSDQYLMLQSEWNDNSWLFDRIPLIKKLGFSLVYGVAHLQQPQTNNWTELSIGIDNLGFSSYRLFRFDFIWVYQNGQYSHFGVRLGSKVI